MAKQYPSSRKGRTQSSSTKVAIPTLSGGVSTQAQSKRLPSEVEQMDNVLLSLERSIEKRPGFSTMLQHGFTGDIDYTKTIIPGEKIDLFALEHIFFEPKDYFFYWFNINESNRFIVVIDYGATSTEKLMYVYKINEDNTWSDVSSTIGSISADTRAYIQYGNADNEAKNVLKATTIGSSIIIVNTLVKAGFTSADTTNHYTINLNGSTSSTVDVKGQKVKYFTSARYTLGSDNKWYVNGVAPTSIQITAGSFTVGTNIILNTPPVLPSTLSHIIPNITTTTTTTPTVSVLNIVVGTVYTILTLGTGTGVLTTAQWTTIGWKSAGGSTVPAIGNTFTCATVGTVGNATCTYTLTTSVTTPAAVNPNTKTKFYIIVSSTQYLIVSGWVGGGLTYTIETIVGTGWAINTAYNMYSGYLLEVEDFIWHNSAEPWFGQSVADFSELRFPPDGLDISGSNSQLYGTVNLDPSALNMLTSLYTSGAGKIYYTASPYLNFGAGYYKIISSNSRPYTEKIRSTDAFSVLDEKRMPQKITFASNVWTAAPIKWVPRTTGTRYSNPGPSVFLSDDKLTPIHISINAVSTFRDRLYMAAGDVVFTSQLGVYEDLFLADPTNITTSDPIDIRASSNTFSEITSLTPFNTYLFINSLGNIQYELKGSQNQITPLTAEISPTSFYSSSKFIEPQLMGSLIYFLDSSKLYLYFSNEASNLAVAQELTATCADYLPTRQRHVCVAAAQNSIAIVDEDNLNHIYFLLSRFAGDKNIQNAFCRYVLNPHDAVLTNKVFDDSLYSIIRRPTTTATSSGPTTLSSIFVAGTAEPTGSTQQYYRYYIEKSYLRTLDTSIPRLDRMIYTKLTDKNSNYDLESNQTQLYFPLSFDYEDVKNIQVITDSSWSNDIDGDRSYEVNTPIGYSIQSSHISLIFSGRLVPAYRAAGTNNLVVNYTRPEENPKYIYIGLKYNMEVTLSKQFVRDQNNNVIDGVFNLRTITTRHKKTGNYDISVSNRSRTPVISSYTNQVNDDTDSLLQLPNFEEDGEFVTNVLGYSDTTDIKISSNYPTPVNIVNLEIKGKFIQKYTSLNT